MKGLATSSNNRAIFSLPGTIVSASPVQRIANQRANRQLSRAAISPATTPIWQQQMLTPSQELQRRFAPQSDTPNTVQPSIPVSPSVPSSVSVQPILQPPQVSRSTDTDASTRSNNADTVSQQPIMSPPQKKEGTASHNMSNRPVPTAEPIPSAPTPTPQTQPSTNKTETNAELSKSLDTITHIRQQIQSQEQKLLQLQKPSQDQQQDIDTEEKTKEALIKNLEQAIQNTQTELHEYETMQGADATVLDSLNKQFKQQKEMFLRLSHERQLLAKKKAEIAEKAIEAQKTKKHINSLQQQHDQLSQQQASPPLEVSSQQPTLPQQPEASIKPVPKEPVKVVMPAITKQPNAINGIVQNAQGKMITDAIVIIKADDQRPLRALKTNELGQFWITTALENGDYEIQTEKDDLSFDTIKIHLNGSLVAPILIKERTAS